MQVLMWLFSLPPSFVMQKIQDRPPGEGGSSYFSAMLCTAVRWTLFLFSPHAVKAPFQTELLWALCRDHLKAKGSPFVISVSVQPPIHFYISQILTKIQITDFLNVETEIWLISSIYFLFSMILLHFQRQGDIYCMNVRSHKNTGTDARDGVGSAFTGNNPAGSPVT